MPILRFDSERVGEIFRARSSRRVSWMRTNSRRAAARMAAQRKKEEKNSQFKSPGQGARGQFGRQSFHAGQQGFNYPHGGYAGLQGHGAERRMSSAGSEGDSFLQGGGDESYDYQHLASDDSRDTQQGTGELGQSQSGFHGVFGNSNNQPGVEGHAEQPQLGAAAGVGEGGSRASPPDIKVEVTPYPFMKTNDFELIEIDPDDEDDI